MSLEGTTEAPHFDRTAFKVKRIYATLAADGKTANFMFATDEQALKCELAPETFSVIPNAWGTKGATTAKLSALSIAEFARRTHGGVAACAAAKAEPQTLGQKLSSTRFRPSRLPSPERLCP